MEIPNTVKIGFVAFDLGSDLHLTIGRRFDATDLELVAMQNFVDGKIRPRLPLTIHFGNFCHMGETGNFPAYKVYFVNPEEDSLVKEFYHTYYKEGPNKALYPWPKFHVTCDTAAKREALEAIIRNNKIFKLHKIDFKSRVEGATIQVAGQQWICPMCATFNSLEMKVCRGEGCDQWRSKELARMVNNFESVGNARETIITEPEMRTGDWTCQVCRFQNFASRTECKNCQRPQLSITLISQAQHATNQQDNSAYYDPPTVPFLPEHCYYDLSQDKPHQVAPRPIKASHRPDWFCSRCRFKVFGSKDHCKCGKRNPYI